MTLLSSLATARRFRIRRKETHHIQPANPRPQRRDCQGQLIAALEDMAGPAVVVTDATMRPWCSATFIGAQHRLSLQLSGSDAAQQADDLATRLRDAEFSLRGHIVADISVDDVRPASECDCSVTLAVLTIEDW
jgi:hypothetical protein